MVDDDVVDFDPGAEVVVVPDDVDVVLFEETLVDDPAGPVEDVLVVVDETLGFVVDVVVVERAVVVVVVGCGTTGTNTGFVAGAGRTASHSAPTPTKPIVSTIVDRRTRSFPVSAIGVSHRCQPWASPEAAAVTGAGEAMPARCNASAIFSRSARPTSNCFPGNVRAITRSWR